VIAAEKKFRARGGKMDSRQVKKCLKKSVWQCRHGYFLWHHLVKKHPEIQNTAVILMPSCEDMDNYYAMLYIDQFLEHSERDNAVLLTHDSRVMQSAASFSANIISVIPFSRKKSEILMKYASLYEFDNRLVIASLNEPVGRNGKSLVGIKGLTEEEIFAIGVYRLFPFRKEEAKAWSGSNLGKRSGE